MLAHVRAAVHAESPAHASVSFMQLVFMQPAQSSAPSGMSTSSFGRGVSVRTNPVSSTVINPRSGFSASLAAASSLTDVSDAEAGASEVVPGEDDELEQPAKTPMNSPVIAIDVLMFSPPRITRKNVAAHSIAERSECHNFLHLEVQTQREAIPRHRDTTVMGLTLRKVAAPPVIEGTDQREPQRGPRRPVSRVLRGSRRRRRLRIVSPQAR